jgi:hypothetical protein
MRNNWEIGLGWRTGIYVLMFKRKNRNILKEKKEMLDVEKINGNLMPRVKQKKLNVRKSDGDLRQSV